MVAAMKQRLLRIWGIIFRAAENTVIKHDGVEHAGYLSFLGLLSAFPFMVLMVSLAGFLGKGDLGRQVIATMRDSLPYDVTQALIPRINEILAGPPSGLLTLSMLAALWTASSAVEGYRTVLNRAYHVGTPPAYIWRRLLSIVQLLIFTILALSGMVVLLVVPVIATPLEHLLGINVFPDGWLEWGYGLRYLSILVIFLVVANMYYVLPNIRQSLRAVVPGAVLTVVSWVVASQVFSLYLSRFHQVNLIYGSLAGIIAAMLYFYILNILFIFGAEVNYQLLRAHGERIIEKQKTADAEKAHATAAHAEI